MHSGKQIFVTVGSTKFDKLIQQFLPTDHPSLVLKAIRQFGYRNVVLQAGNSSHAFKASSVEAIDISVEVYGFKPDLDKDIRDSDLIISHAGSGSILESLRLGKRLIVVANDTLADNHQLELAEELERRNHLVLCKPGELIEAIEKLEKNKSGFTFAPFPDQAKNALQKCLNELL